MPKKVLLLGAGMVGRAMACDLARTHQITLADISPDALAKAKAALITDGQVKTAIKATEQAKSASMQTLSLDLRDQKALQSLLDQSKPPFDLVVCALPGHLGFQTLESVIGCGVDIVDISFLPENALDLNSLARQHNVSAVVDCGVAPGMSNMLLGHFNEKMKVASFECMVGGLPKTRKWPFNYKAPFSPSDVIEEYMRPARLVENGREVTREALSDVELVHFSDIGTLEAFNTDGLRTLIHTMPHIPDMKEKTLRYPGHAEYIRVFRECGFFDEMKLRLDDNTLVSPREVTSKLLFKSWMLEDEEEEMTVMRVAVRGGNKKVVVTLHDRYCHETRISSMARTTGYTATAVASLLLSGHIKEKGVLPPETIGREDSHFDFIISYLQERGVFYQFSESLEPPEPGTEF